MRQTALHRIEERFAPSDRDTRGPALHYTSYRIALFQRTFYHHGEKTTFALTAYLRNLCGYGYPTGREHLFGYNARSQPESYTSREVTATAIVVMPAVFDTGNEIGMARARMADKSRIVAATGILVVEQHSHGGPGGMPLEKTADYMRRVGLLTWRGSARSRTTPVEIGGEVLLAKRHSGGYAVYHRSYVHAVRFAEYRYSEKCSCGVHS